MKTLGRKLSRLALSFLYVDGHVRVYHGERNLPKAHVARMRLWMPATTDYIDRSKVSKGSSSTTQGRGSVGLDKIKQMERFKALYFCEGRKRPSLVALRSL